MFSERRFTYLAIAPVVILSLLIFRLFYLQIIKGENYKQRSESNFIQERPIPHSRGLITDQSGIPLVDNRPARDLYVTFALLPDSFKSLKKTNEALLFPLAKLKELHKSLEEEIEKQSDKQIHYAKLTEPKACSNLMDLIISEQMTGIDVIRTKNGMGCDVVITPALFPSARNTFRNLAEILEIEWDDMKDLMERAEKKAKGLGRFKPILLMSDISFEAYARISNAVSLGQYYGIAVFDSVKRRYIQGSFAAHALGFLNEVSVKDLRQNADYKAGDRIGRKGLELSYEADLRGQDGVERFVVDAKGRRYEKSWEDQLLSGSRIEPPKAGNNLLLSIDFELQKAVESAFSGKAGSVVALDISTGFVLAMASFPNYDPNEIIARKKNKLLASMSSDPLKPWLNKSIQEHYAPGSTFKAVTAVAAMEHGLITTSSRRFCSGTFHLGKSSWRCFRREGHGEIGLVEALKTSCDSYFYQVGYQLGPDKLANTARLLGFGRKTGIDLDMEIAGNIPDTAYYKRRFKYYAPGFVVNNSIGQGEVTVTPLQLAVAYAALVNGGRIYKPQLVRQVISPSGQVVVDHQPIEVAHLAETTRELALVREGLSHVMQPGGTAYGVRFRQDLPELSNWLKTSDVNIGGKTGTAQVVKLSKSIKHLRPEEVTYLQRDHAWFVGFAPAENPEIVIVAMTEHGGFGGTASAPVVAEAVKTWYDKVRGHGNYAHLGGESRVVGNQ